MNTQLNTSIDLSSIVNAQVAERVKIAKAVEAANEAMKVANEHNILLSKAAADLVSNIQKQLHQDQKDLQLTQRQAYESEMCRLGLSSQVYPLETALLAVEKNVIAPPLKAVGIVAGNITNVSKGIFNRIKQGFNAATK